MELTKEDFDDAMREHVKSCQTVNALTFLKRPPFAIVVPVIVALVGMCVGGVYAYWSGINNLAEVLGKKVESNSASINVLGSSQRNYAESLREFKVEMKQELSIQRSDIREILRAVKN